MTTQPTRTQPTPGPGRNPITIQEFDAETSTLEHGRHTIRYHLGLIPNDNGYADWRYVPDLLRTFSDLPDTEKDEYRRIYEERRTGQMEMRL